MNNERDFKGVWIPKEIWLNEDLTMLEKVILVEIDSLDNENGCSASNEYLAEFCQCSETKVSTAISKLIDLGYIYLKSFNGRVRILKSRLSNFERQDLKNLKADYKNFKPNNIDNNIDNNIKKESKKVSYEKVLEQNNIEGDLKDEYFEFIKMRQQIKKPMTNRALQLLIDNVRKLSNNEVTAIKILDQSIVNCWQSVYPLKEPPKPEIDLDAMYSI